MFVHISFPERCQLKLAEDLSSDQIRIQNFLRERAGLDPIPDPETMLHCGSCGRWKPDAEFYRSNRNKEKKRRYRTWECNLCARERRAQLRDKYRERERARWRAEKRQLAIRNRETRERRVGDVKCEGCGQWFRHGGIVLHQKHCLTHATQGC